MLTEHPTNPDRRTPRSPFEIREVLSSAFQCRSHDSIARPYDTACFHAQQAAEKYLKAILAVSGAPIPRTHDLEDIFEHCLAVAPALVLDPMELSLLTPYAVQLRYDVGFWPDRGTAGEAIATVDRVHAAVLSVLPPAAHP